MWIARWLGSARRRLRVSGGRASWLVPRPTTLFFVLTFVVFTCVEPYLAAVNNPNENSRTYLTMAIVENHSFRLDPIVERHGWIGDLGRAREHPTPDAPEAPFDPRIPSWAMQRPPGFPQPSGGDTFYMSVKAPATSYFGVPFYWAFTKIAPLFGHPVPTLRSSIPERMWWLRATTFWLRFWTVQLPNFAFLVWFERWLRRTTDDGVLRLSAVAAVAFGSNFLAYSLMYVSHATCAVAAFAGFGVTLRARLDTESRLRKATTAFGVGLLVGLVPLLEYTAVPVALFLGLYGLVTFRRPRQLLAFLTGGAINVFALTFYQAKACEGWLSPCPKLAEGFFWLHSKSFGFGKPSWAFLRDASISRSCGFFGMSPYMGLGLLAIVFGLFVSFGTGRERREMRWATLTWFAAMASLWLFVSSASNPHGGWSIGPRYLGAAPPFFAFGATVALEQISRHSRASRVIARAAAAGLALASAVQVGIVSIVYNTVSETMARPLWKFALPLARAGFVPYHAGDLFGFSSPRFWYFVAGCLVVAVAIPAIWPSRDSAWSWTLRVTGVVVVATLGILPAFRMPGSDEPFDPGFTHYIVTIWEPAGRDRITTTRVLAEKNGATRPCLWNGVADLEKDVGMAAEAARDAMRAGATKEICF